jgi:hypothetical protein
MRATSDRALALVAIVASLAARASAGDSPNPCAHDPPHAEMLLELDLLAEPGFERLAPGWGEGASPKASEPSDDFDPELDSDGPKPNSRAPER